MEDQKSVGMEAERVHGWIAHATRILVTGRCGMVRVEGGGPKTKCQAPPAAPSRQVGHLAAQRSDDRFVQPHDIVLHFALPTPALHGLEFLERREEERGPEP